MVALACLWATATAHATTLQKIGDFESPIYVTSDPGNPERLFVVERAGKIVEVEGAARTVFADLSSLVSSAGEGGLLSIALAPDFDTSGRLFVDYAGKEEPGEIAVAELRASGGSAPLSTLRNLLTIEHPEDANHYGGQLQFGPEGMLFVSTGDGGGENDVHENAQNLESGLGKILRISPTVAGIPAYTVPAGNPFAGGNFEPIVWSYGLRNPYRFSFDRLTGAIFIGDVGQNAKEEVDSAAAPGLGAGADYGWNCREGTIPGTATDPQCAEPPAGGFVEPIFEYGHEGGRCAIIGGYVSRGGEMPGLYGRYLYGDWCTGELRSFDPADPYGSDRSEGLTVANLDSFGEDSCGRLYAVSGDGPVYRLTGAAPASCTTASVQPLLTPEPLAFAYAGIKAHGRRVRRGRRALLTAWVSPCAGRKGEPVKLWRGRVHVATKHLDRACVVRFRPRIGRRSNFRARIAEDGAYAGATSRALKIKVAHHKRHRTHRRLARPAR